MNGVNKTMYIPLYGKAYVSRRGILLQDTKAEQIWCAEGFPLKGKASSKWLAFYMGMRSAVFDNWLLAQLREAPDAVVVHLGCGMDSRIVRIGSGFRQWYDIDFPEVIAERRRYFTETEAYKMLPADIRESSWLEGIPEHVPAIVLLEGVSMYLTTQERNRLMEQLTSHFSSVKVLMDCYTIMAAKASRYKNPINEVGVTQVYGLDSPDEINLTFVREHALTPQSLIDQLSGMEKQIFKSVFAGSFSKKLYRLYEYKA